MAEIKDGGPAFPGRNPKGTMLADGSLVRIDDGMSLRDYFAAAALQGMLASFDLSAAQEQNPGEFLRKAGDASFQVADAMLRAREQKPEGV